MAKTIALVACVSKKNKRPMVARDLYISDWFKKASAYADTISDKRFILLAKYGLVDPISVFAPYNETLNNMPISKRRTWSLKVMQDLGHQLNTDDHIVILTGLKYREFLIEPLRFAIRRNSSLILKKEPGVHLQMKENAPRRKPCTPAARCGGSSALPMPYWKVYHPASATSLPIPPRLLIVSAIAGGLDCQNRDGFFMRKPL